MQGWWIKCGGKSLGRRPFQATERQRPQLGPATEVEHFELPFRQWDGPIGPWSEHFGKARRGQVYSLDGGTPVRSCNEVEVARLLRRIRTNAFWISPYTAARVPVLWETWVLSMANLPSWLSQLDVAVRERITSRKGGIPDVVAWNDDEPLRTAIFVECKGPKESFKEGQEDWLWAALREGIDWRQFAVSVRPF